MAVLVIGQGRMGTALAKALRGTHGSVAVMSAREFLGAKAVDTNFDSVCFCGRARDLTEPKTAGKIIAAVNEDGEVLDFSNPSSFRASDLCPALRLAEAAKGYRNVYKICKLSVYDFVESFATADVYSGGGCSPCSVPQLQIPGIAWQIPRYGGAKLGLLDEVRIRASDRAGVLKFMDAAAIAFAIFVYTSIYAWTRYSELVNGKYPWDMMPMYVFDKALCWAALYTITACPFAGNVLAVLDCVSRGKKDAVSISVLVVVVPVLMFSIVLYTPALIIYMVFRQVTHSGVASDAKQMLIDWIMMKHELGVLGFFLAFTHASLGMIICDSYKGKWFNKAGRLMWQYEVSMTAGALALTMLLVVALRSMFGKDSWAKLKPMYTYLSPIALASSATHVVMMGFKGWPELFDPEVHGGQPSITFVGSMGTISVLAVWFTLQGARYIVPSMFPPLELVPNSRESQAIVTLQAIQEAHASALASVVHRGVCSSL